MTETISTLISEGVASLTDVSDTPQLDSYLLVGEVLKKTRAWLIAHSDEKVCAADAAQIQVLLTRRCSGEPVAYIRGVQSFWQRDFCVTRDTLIPRPETELLMELLMTRVSHSPKAVLDLGTGTGALAISIAAERPGWTIVATDVNDDTLAVAEKNAGTLTNVRFVSSSWFDEIEGSFDVIVSNPPYVRDNDPHLATLKFEPLAALTAGEDGLDCIREIITHSSAHLVPGGHILIEHGYDQQAAVIQLLASGGFSEVEGLRDLHGRPRAVLARSMHHER